MLPADENREPMGHEVSKEQWVLVGRLTTRREFSPRECGNGCRVREAFSFWHLRKEQTLRQPVWSKKLSRVGNSLSNGVSKAQTIENLADCGCNGYRLTLNQRGVPSVFQRCAHGGRCRGCTAVQIVSKQPWFKRLGGGRSAAGRPVAHGTRWCRWSCRLHRQS